MLIRNTATVGAHGIVLRQMLVAEQGATCQDICTLTFFYNKNKKPLRL